MAFHPCADRAQANGIRRFFPLAQNRPQTRWSDIRRRSSQLRNILAQFAWGNAMIGLYHYVALGMFAGFALLEIVSRGRNFPPVTRWRLKGAGFTLLYFALATYAPLFWDGWLGEHRLLAGDQLPLWAQLVLGFLALEFGIYAWHRTMHNAPFLWRWFHQMHHSSEG